MTMLRWTVPLFSALALVSLGCKREEIQVYQAPKDSPAPAPTAAATASNGAGEQAAEARPPWDVPEGWTRKQATSSMRIASYEVKAADGRSLDISVIPLGGQSGSLLDNVNRWRNELKLAPVTEAELAAQVQPVPIGTQTGQMLNLVSTEPTLEGRFKERTLAGILPLGTTTVFFKLRGEDALAQENLPKFLAWLKSVATGAAPPPETTAAPPPGMSGPVAPPPSTGVPQWEPPAHWKAGGPRPMRLASFEVPGAGNQSADLSISALGGAAGGLLPNINRWRTQQLGLAAATEADLAKISSQVPAGDGSATLVDFSGEGEQKGTRMLAAIATRDDRTWFFKLTGPEAVVAAERDNFVKFLKSVKF